MRCATLATKQVIRALFIIKKNMKNLKNDFQNNAASNPYGVTIINMDEVKKKVIEFNSERDWDQFHSPENLAKSISIEAGELLECFQWNSNFDKKEVCEELADVVNYCILLADKLDVRLEDIFSKNLKKHEKNILSKRLGEKY